jgi:hypothetical protein
MTLFAASHSSFPSYDLFNAEVSCLRATEAIPPYRIPRRTSPKVDTFKCDVPPLTPLFTDQMILTDTIGFAALGIYLPYHAHPTSPCSVQVPRDERRSKSFANPTQPRNAMAYALRKSCRQLLPGQSLT